MNVVGYRLQGLLTLAGTTAIKSFKPKQNYFAARIMGWLLSGGISSEHKLKVFFLNLLPLKY